MCRYIKLDLVRSDWGWLRQIESNVTFPPCNPQVAYLWALMLPGISTWLLGMTRFFGCHQFLQLWLEIQSFKAHKAWGTHWLLYPLAGTVAPPGLLGRWRWQRRRQRRQRKSFFRRGAWRLRSGSEDKLGVLSIIYVIYVLHIWLICGSDLVSVC